MAADFIGLKKKALEKYFSKMNPEQQKAVFKINGPLLILAGAGSGKTTVLINRIANMIYFGNAYNCGEGYGNYTQQECAFLEDYINGKTDDASELSEIVGYETVKPWNILAITFTNKAAGELKERLAAMLGEAGEGVMASTFHSACVRILRRECAQLGYSSNFTIYDSDDSQRTIKTILKDLDIPDKMFPPKVILGEISRQKDQMIDHKQYEISAGGDYRLMTVAKVYTEYQRRLKLANAMDFDDIIFNTVRLFENDADALDHYQNLYKYIMVDEYQDTNMAQFRLVHLLASKNHNICVVGDDDQSIYKFRGATIENILGFEDQFGCDPQADVIRLEQNYRSTQNILTCANELIKNNTARKGKNLWTDMGNGEKVVTYKAASEKSEAKFIADSILDAVGEGAKYNDHAVLYRINAQSNSIERAFIQSGIPYKIFGGLKFYDRKEIKDVLAYLQVINNPSDMLRLRRIINEPKRGIGDATVALLEQISSDLGENPVEVMKNAEDLAPIAKRAKQLTSLADMFERLSELSQSLPLEDLLDELLDVSGYSAYLETQGDEGVARLENIAELKTTMAQYEEENEEPSLSGFLEQISLFTDIDTLDQEQDYVALMTMHSAKGLEFPTVFVVGMEENLFPSSRSLESEEDIEEERRLAYVAMTRAKKKLILTRAGERMLYGHTDRNRKSRFLRELPTDCIEKQQEQGLSSMYSSSQGANEFGTVRSMTLKQQLELKRSEKSTSSNTGTGLTFASGDRIKHKIFGEGTVLNATPMGNDTLLEIAFDSKGTKKIMANYAKITKA